MFTNQEEEAKFKRYFAECPDRALSRCSFISKETPLYGAYDLLKREVYEVDENNKRVVSPKTVGRIDLMFKYKGRIFVGEVKYQSWAKSDFWDALKVVGYCSYLNWQARLNPNFQTTYPAIIIPESAIKLEHKIVAGDLKITMFGIKKINEKEYKMNLEFYPF